eukprot:6468865-Amphidinium_carterae.1
MPQLPSSNQTCTTTNCYKQACEATVLCFGAVFGVIALFNKRADSIGTNLKLTEVKENVCGNR